MKQLQTTLSSMAFVIALGGASICAPTVPAHADDTIEVLNLRDFVGVNFDDGFKQFQQGDILKYRCVYENGCRMRIFFTRAFNFGEGAPRDCEYRAEIQVFDGMIVVPFDCVQPPN